MPAKKRELPILQGKDAEKFLKKKQKNEEIAKRKTKINPDMK
ncbi:hypothetical protein ACFQPF_05205 [Fictibacillus iocasae]|uniref:Uncharacterized protein n=1 Tax=Fictibacillus iocasae TaxID=2715437 RepID=A0ABW2NMM5_9BACL